MNLKNINSKNCSLSLVACKLLVIVGFVAQVNALELDEVKSLFKHAHLVSGPELVDCTLSAGSETTCVQITVKPIPKTYTPGPWCPESISDTAEEGGIWLDSKQVHDVTGSFIENLDSFYSDPNWQLFDKETGKIFVTDTLEKCAGAAKPDVDPEYQQHCVECQLSYLDDNASVTYTIPVNPIVVDQISQTRRSGAGVAFNGVRLDGPAPVSDILGNYTLAPFDDCGGHINLNVGYHYHAATDCLKDTAHASDHATDKGSVVGLAMDGHFIHAHELNDGTLPQDLDQCGGHAPEGIAYHYHAGEQGGNEILACLVAEHGCVSSGGGACNASANTRSGGAPRLGNGPPARGGKGGPDFSAAAEKLGVSETQLKRALGGPPPNFEAASKALGVTIEDLQNALGRP